MAFLLSKARAAVKNKVNAFIDAQVTSQLKPFLEIGTGPDGEPCSDFVVNEDGDMSIENMMLKPHIINERLVQMGSPLRVAMVRCKRIFFDLPWGDLAGGKYNLVVDDLMIVLYPLEHDQWSVEDVRAHPPLASPLSMHTLDASPRPAPRSPPPHSRLALLTCSRVLSPSPPPLSSRRPRRRRSPRR